MSVSFRAPFQSAGVDADRKPAGMIVPRRPGGSNFACLAAGSGLTLSASRGLEIKEFKDLRPPLTLIAGVILALEGKTPTLDFLIARTFQVTANHAAPRTGGKITAVNPRTKRVEATLEVAVLNERRIKLAVRPVLIPDPGTGAPRLHSKKPFDIATLVAQMNSIWSPQANVVFTLVSSAPVLIDDGAAIAKSLGLLAASATLPAIVDIQKFESLLDANKDKSADLTMFLVEQAADTDPAATRPHVVAGATNAALGISLIGDDRTLQPELMAHEAGHFIGDSGYRTGSGHPTSDPKALMRTGGSPFAKISFDEATLHFNRS